MIESKIVGPLDSEPRRLLHADVELDERTRDLVDLLLQVVRLRALKLHKPEADLQIQLEGLLRAANIQIAVVPRDCTSELNRGSTRP